MPFLRSCVADRHRELACRPDCEPAVWPFLVSNKEFQTELHEARRAGLVNAAKAWGGKIRNGKREVRVIGDIENLRTELQLAALAQRKILQERHINIRKPRTADDVTSCIAELSGFRDWIQPSERGTTDPFFDGMRSVIRIGNEIRTARKET